MDNSEWQDKAEKKQKLARGVLMALGGIALLVIGGSGVYYALKQKPQLLGISSEQKNPQVDEVQTLVSEIGKIIEIPQGETPTLATVTDVSKVKDQQFFAKAKEGDKVLVYANAKKAYLYRPSDKKIIEVGVVNIDKQQAQSKPEATITKTTPTLIPTAIPTQSSNQP